MQAWEKQVRQEIPSLQDVEAFSLVNSLPKLIKRISDTLEARDYQESGLNAPSQEHAKCRARLAHYSVEQISVEYRVLRKTIFSILESVRPLSLADRDCILDTLSGCLSSTYAEFCRLEQAKTDQSRLVAESLKERYEDVVNHLTHAIAWISDAVDNRFIFVSRQAEAILGYPVQRWLSEPHFLELHLHPEDRTLTREVFEKARQTGKEQIAEHRVIAADGKIIWFQTSVQAEVDGFNNAVCFRGLCFDITKRKNTEAENLRLLALSKMDLERLREEREIRERFVNALTHDLRNPLAGVRLTAQMLMRDGNATVKERSARILKIVDRVDRMVKDLLDANRIRAGQPLPLRLGRVNLCQIAQDVIADFVVTHGPRFTFNAPKEAFGIWSEEGLRRILENLISNALKYGAKIAPITVTVRTDKEKSELSVHNEGNEIPAEDQSHLFELFHRGKSASSCQETGWGIGLTLVRGITAALGGTVRVQSKLGNGTTFSVELPPNAMSFQSAGNF